MLYAATVSPASRKETYAVVHDVCIFHERAGERAGRNWRHERGTPALKVQRWHLYEARTEGRRARWGSSEAVGAVRPRERGTDFGRACRRACRRIHRFLPALEPCHSLRECFCCHACLLVRRLIQSADLARRSWNNSRNPKFNVHVRTSSKPFVCSRPRTRTACQPCTTATRTCCSSRCRTAVWPAVSS